ncbi:hypothetical protein NKG94_18795 [Micromonospora sp. M12]
MRLRDGVPPAIAAVLVRATAHRPADRYPTPRPCTRRWTERAARRDGRTGRVERAARRDWPRRPVPMRQQLSPR